MPLHDWTQVPTGLYHDFHQGWTVRIARELNRGHLPKGNAALIADQRGIFHVGRALNRSHDDRIGPHVEAKSTKEFYAGRANRIVIRRHLAKPLAVIEIVSPGNKDSRAAFRDFIEKTIEFFRQGIHVLVVDLFPPTPRDPFGIHKAIWDEIGEEEDFEFPAGKDRILASYKSGGEKVAYVEPVGVGDELPDMPIFLAESLHVMVPLANTYEATWEVTPEELRTAVETGVMPEPDAD